MTCHFTDEELSGLLECALEKQIFALRALLSSLVEEEKTYLNDNKEIVYELLDERLFLLENYENAEAKSISLIEIYLLEKTKPPLLKMGLKIEQLQAFKADLSIQDINLSFQIDQLVSLLDKIQETSHNLQVLDQQGHSHHVHILQEELPKKKIKVQIGVID